LLASEQQLPNCLVTAHEYTDSEELECWQCEDGYTFDESYNCVLVDEASCPSVTVDSCTYCEIVNEDYD